jgi:hypothetical protein
MSVNDGLHCIYYMMDSYTLSLTIVDSQRNEAGPLISPGDLVPVPYRGADPEKRSARCGQPAERRTTLVSEHLTYCLSV